MPAAAAAAANGTGNGGLAAYLNESAQGKPLEEDTTIVGAAESEIEGFWKHQSRIRSHYQGTRSQVVVVGLIAGNFFVQCLQAQIDPERSEHILEWEIVEHFFNIAFAFELGVNLYGHWYKPFFKSYWNIFDVVVVFIGLLDSLQTPMPGPLRLVRMVRAFRAFRLFGKVESLRKIIASLRCALPGVFNAFVIMAIVMAIYAVLGVNFFKDIYLKDCLVEHGTPAPLFTGRAMCYGEDYYGRFASSIYTLFQVLTGESWSEAVARPTLHYYQEAGSWSSTTGAAFFYVSFILLNAVVLMNIIIALLIDGMARPPKTTAEPAKTEDTTEDETSQGDAEQQTGEPQGEAKDVSTQEQIKGLKDDVTNVQLELAELSECLKEQAAVMLSAVQRRQQQRGVQVDSFTL
jgi:hypothetical protein